MSTLRCRRCDAAFDGHHTPACPACLAARWRGLAGFVAPKHDPRAESDPLPGYRSILTPRFVAELDAFIDHAAQHGRWYLDAHYGQYVHFTPEPLGHVVGVGVPAGAAQPEHALDSMLVADAAGDAHVFAVARDVFEAQVQAGEFAPLAACQGSDCALPHLPGEAHCAHHAGRARPAAEQYPQSSATTSPTKASRSRS